jgi:hypothetical protein
VAEVATAVKEAIEAMASALSRPEEISTEATATTTTTTARVVAMYS